MSGDKPLPMFTMSLGPVPMAQSVVTPRSQRRSAPAAFNRRGGARSEFAELHEALRGINKNVGTQQSGKLREALQVIRISATQLELSQSTRRVPKAVAKVSQSPARNPRWSCPAPAPRVAEAIQSLRLASNSPAQASRPKVTREWVHVKQAVQSSRARWSTPKMPRGCADIEHASPKSSAGSMASVSTCASEASDSPLSQADLPLNFKGEPPLANLCAQTSTSQTSQPEVGHTPSQISKDPGHDHTRDEAGSSSESGSFQQQNHQELDTTPLHISKDPRRDEIRAEVDPTPLQMSKDPRLDRVQAEAEPSLASSGIEQQNHREVDPTPLLISPDARHGQNQAEVKPSVASVDAQQQNHQEAPAYLVPVGTPTRYGQVNKHENDQSLFGLCFIGLLQCLVGIQFSVEAVFEAVFKDIAEPA